MIKSSRIHDVLIKIRRLSKLTAGLIWFLNKWIINKIGIKKGTYSIQIGSSGGEKS